MIPIIPLRSRLASPLLFLLLVGGAIAAIDYWVRSLPHDSEPKRRRSATSKLRPRARRQRSPSGQAA